jgi:hypothetical protein
MQKDFAVISYGLRTAKRNPSNAEVPEQPNRTDDALIVTPYRSNKVAKMLRWNCEVLDFSEWFLRSAHGKSSSVISSP